MFCKNITNKTKSEFCPVGLYSDLINRHFQSGKQLVTDTCKQLVTDTGTQLVSLGTTRDYQK